MEAIMNKIIKLSFLLLAFFLDACQSSFFVNHVTPAPTPQCVEPALLLGDIKYGIEPVSREPNSFPDIPRGKKDVAFWVDDTTVNYVFALNPTRDNLALDTTLNAGDPAVINWADCSQDEYILQSIDTTAARDLNVFDQSSGGITIYVQSDSSTLVMHGERPVVQPAETEAPATTSAIQIDVRLLNPPPAEEGTVKIALELTNRGSQAITLEEGDISLTAENSPEVFPSSVEPALPQELQPGFPLTVFVTFPKPDAASAVLRIFDVTFDYYLQ